MELLLHKYDGPSAVSSVVVFLLKSHPYARWPPIYMNHISSSGENGRPVARGEIPYRFVRKKDGKVFKWARFAPQYSEVHNCTALEEI